MGIQAHNQESFNAGAEAKKKEILKLLNARRIAHLEDIRKIEKAFVEDKKADLERLADRRFKSRAYSTEIDTLYAIIEAGF